MAAKPRDEVKRLRSIELEVLKGEVDQTDCRLPLFVPQTRS